MARGPFHRTKGDAKMLGGVCGGVARYFDMDPKLVRILWVVVSLVSVGLGVLAYLALWIFTPDE